MERGKGKVKSARRLGGKFASSNINSLSVQNIEWFSWQSTYLDT